MTADMCKYNKKEPKMGLLLKKPTGFLVASSSALEELSSRGGGNREHGQIFGSVTSAEAGVWTYELAVSMIKRAVKELAFRSD